MASKSATVLVIFIIAIFAFCLASVFAVMTGPISIMPEQTESGGLLDNLSAITDEDDTEDSYNYQDYDYSNDDYSSDDSQIETTTAPAQQSSHSHDSSDVETTTDDSPSDSGDSGRSSEDSGSKDTSGDDDGKTKLSSFQTTSMTH